jgi:hypothetical protein
MSAEPAQEPQTPGPDLAYMLSMNTSIEIVFVTKILHLNCNCTEIVLDFSIVNTVKDGFLGSIFLKNRMLGSSSTAF